MKYKEYDDIVLKDGREGVITDILGPDSYVVNIEDYDPGAEYPEHTVFRIVLDGKNECDLEIYTITQEEIEKARAESKEYNDINGSRLILPDFILTDEYKELRERFPLKRYKLRYIGKSFGVASLTDGRIYDAIDFDQDYYRVFDDSEEGYLYSRINPAPVDGSSPGGRWEIIEEKIIK